MNKLQAVPRGQLQSFPMRAPLRTAHGSPGSHCGTASVSPGAWPGRLPPRPDPCDQHPTGLAPVLGLAPPSTQGWVPTAPQPSRTKGTQLSLFSTAGSSLVPSFSSTSCSASTCRRQHRGTPSPPGHRILSRSRVAPIPTGCTLGCNHRSRPPHSRLGVGPGWRGIRAVAGLGGPGAHPTPQLQPRVSSPAPTAHSHPAQHLPSPHLSQSSPSGQDGEGKPGKSCKFPPAAGHPGAPGRAAARNPPSAQEQQQKNSSEVSPPPPAPPQQPGDTPAQPEPAPQAGQRAQEHPKGAPELHGGWRWPQPPGPLPAPSPPGSARAGSAPAAAPAPAPWCPAGQARSQPGRAGRARRFPCSRCRRSSWMLTDAPGSAGFIPPLRRPPAHRGSPAWANTR